MPRLPYDPPDPPNEHEKNLALYLVVAYVLLGGLLYVLQTTP